MKLLIFSIAERTRTLKPQKRKKWKSKLKKELERENKELKQANEILKKAAAFFAQAELDRKPKK